MVLNDATMQQLNLLQNAQPGFYRGSSYDLTIGAIITSDGEAVADHALEPQGVVKVVSAEIVDLPPNVIGYVHVKTHLCNIGVLTLNIGIVDPGFSGPLQSTIINFGKNKYRLYKGEVFGRITFHELAKPDVAISRMPCIGGEKVVWTTEDVVKRAKYDVDHYLAKDFLDLAKTARRAADAAIGQYRTVMFFYLPLFVGILGVLTYFLNSSNVSKMEGVLNVKDRVTEQRELEGISMKLGDLAEKNKALSEEIARLKSHADSTLPKPSVARRPGVK
jgi:hypothetical protein